MTQRYKFVIGLESNKNICGYESRELEGIDYTRDEDELIIAKGEGQGVAVFNFARVLFYSVTPIQEEPVS